MRYVKKIANRNYTKEGTLWNYINKLDKYNYIKKEKILHQLSQYLHFHILLDSSSDNLLRFVDPIDTKRQVEVYAYMNILYFSYATIPYGIYTTHRIKKLCYVDTISALEYVKLVNLSDTTVEQPSVTHYYKSN